MISTFISSSSRHAPLRRLSMNDKPRVFVSYAQSDAAFARKLAQSLRSSGAEIWMDTDIKPGEVWADRIREELGKAKFVVVLLTPDSLKSSWLYLELGAAVADKKSIVAVVLEDVDPGSIPPFLQRYQFIRDTAPEPAGQRIAEVIKQSAGRVSGEPVTAP